MSNEPTLTNDTLINNDKIAFSTLQDYDLLDDDMVELLHQTNKDILHKCVRILRTKINYIYLCMSTILGCLSKNTPDHSRKKSHTVQLSTEQFTKNEPSNNENQINYTNNPINHNNIMEILRI